MAEGGRHRRPQDVRRQLELEGEHQVAAHPEADPEELARRRTRSTGSHEPGEGTAGADRDAGDAGRLHGQGEQRDELANRILCGRQWKRSCHSRGLRSAEAGLARRPSISMKNCAAAFWTAIDHDG